MALIERPPAGGIAGLHIAIVGLGLMGGSIARALKRKTDAVGGTDAVSETGFIGGSGTVVTALDRDGALVASALAEGVIDRGCADPAEAFRDADLVVLCLYPSDTVKFIVDNMGAFRSGSVITDICGVKRPVVDGVLPDLRRDVDFVPGHPMAGRERAGYRYSDAALFDGCNYILTPTERNSEKSLTLVKRFAGALGAANIVLASPEEHDEMIAYTSQLPHALAVAYVLEAGERDPLPFSAGSYRDVSRVAAINAAMWAELFLMNAGALLAETERLKAGLNRIEDCIRSGDRQRLTALLADAARLREERL